MSPVSTGYSGIWSARPEPTPDPRVRPGVGVSASTVLAPTAGRLSVALIDP